MERLTEKGYKYHSCDFMEDGTYEWANRLSEYEDTGLTPEQICEMDKLYQEKCREVAELRKKMQWIPLEERLPENDDYALMSFMNFSLPAIGRYATDEDGGAWYLGDCDEDDTCVAADLFVNAWMPLPEQYKGD